MILWLLCQVKQVSAYGGWPPNKMIQILLPRFVCLVKPRLPKGQLEFHLGGVLVITIAFTCLCIIDIILLLCRDHDRYPLWICRKRKVDRCNLLLRLGYPCKSVIEKIPWLSSHSSNQVVFSSVKSISIVSSQPFCGL